MEQGMLVAILSVMLANGSPNEAIDKGITNTFGNDVSVGQVIDINTTRIQGTGSMNGYTCWQSPVYGSNGITEVRIKCQ